MRGLLRSPLLVIGLAFLLSVCVAVLVLFRNQARTELEVCKNERDELTRQNEILKAEKEAVLTARLLDGVPTKPPAEGHALSREDLDFLQKLIEGNKPAGATPVSKREVKPRLILDNRYIAAVRSVKFSADSKMIAAGGDSTSLNVWDAQTGNPIADFRDSDDTPGETDSVDFSPDGTILAAGSFTQIQLWDLHKQKVLATLEDHGGAIAFSPDGKTLAARASDGVKLWDVATRKERAMLKVADGGGVTAIQFAPSGRFLAIGVEKGVVYGRSATDPEDPPFLILNHSAKKSQLPTGINSLVLTNDSKILASVGADGNIRLWATNGAKLHTLRGKLCAFAPDGKQVFILQLGTITVWDVRSGKKRAEIDGGPFFPALTMTISPDGTTLAIGCDNGRVHLWDVKNLLEGIK